MKKKKNSKKKKRLVRLLDTSGKNKVIAVRTKKKITIPSNSKYDTLHFMYQIEKGKQGNVKSHLTKVTKKQMNNLLRKRKAKSRQKVSE